MASMLIKKEDLEMTDSKVVGTLVSLEMVEDVAYGYYNVNNSILAVKVTKEGISSILLPDWLSNKYSLNSCTVLDVKISEKFNAPKVSSLDYFLPQNICLNINKAFPGNTVFESILLYQLVAMGFKTNSNLVELDIIDMVSIVGVNTDDTFIFTKMYFNLVSDCNENERLSSILSSELRDLEFKSRTIQ